MGKNRKRKRVRDKALKEGIPVAKLGAEFEWIDERLKVGLEAYPTFKRPLGKAEMAMVLSLGLYYNDITKKWEPLSAIDISTVRNQARFYSVNPPDLTTDVYDNMRIDKNQNLLCNDVILDKIMSGITDEKDVVGVDIQEYFIESIDYMIDHITLAIYDVVGVSNQVKIDYRLPDNTNISIFSDTAITATSLTFYKIIDWSKFRIWLSCGSGCEMSIRIRFQKFHKYYP